MGDFFHGWRRKTGLVTLVMSLALMGGWIRSLVFLEMIGFCRDSNHDRFIFSNNAAIGWASVEHAEFRPGDFYQNSAVQTDILAEINVDWRWHWCGFDFAKGNQQQPISLSVVVWCIPYWAITLFGTLFSGYLLLKKDAIAVKAVRPSE